MTYKAVFWTEDPKLFSWSSDPNDIKGKISESEKIIFDPQQVL
jgi:hypothetical protein